MFCARDTAPEKPAAKESMAPLPRTCVSARRRFASVHCVSAGGFAAPTKAGGIVSNGDTSLHCLSAFRAFHATERAVPGVHLGLSLHCLSAFRAFPATDQQPKARVELHRVFIAFRRSGRSPPAYGSSQVRAYGCLHCLSAFRAFPASGLVFIGVLLCIGLHCLSAFRAFPASFPG